MHRTYEKTVFTSTEISTLGEAYKYENDLYCYKYNGVRLLDKELDEFNNTEDNIVVICELDDERIMTCKVFEGNILIAGFMDSTELSTEFVDTIIMDYLLTQ